MSKYEKVEQHNYKNTLYKVIREITNLYCLKKTLKGNYLCSWIKHQFNLFFSQFNQQITKQVHLWGYKIELMRSKRHTFLCCLNTFNISSQNVLQLSCFILRSLEQHYDLIKLCKLWFILWKNNIYHECKACWHCYGNTIAFQLS